MSSLAITDPLAGCVHLVERAENTDSSLVMDLPRDSNGCSTAIRIASYTTKLLKANDVFSLLDENKQTAIFKGIVLVMQLANDNLGLAGANHLWTQYDSDIEEDIFEFISDAHSIIVKLLRAGLGGLALQPHAQDGFWMSTALGATSARFFYLARASSLVYSELVELSGFKLSDAPVWIEALTEYRKNEGKKAEVLT
jgi:E3 ubiquitin-protein ligase listerin